MFYTKPSSKNLKTKYWSKPKYFGWIGSSLFADVNTKPILMLSALAW